MNHYLQVILPNYKSLILGPWSYLCTGAVLGITIWYYDGWRRRAVEELLYSEERKRYHSNFFHY